MKILIAYSSKTGNTRKLAEAIHLALPGADLCPVENAPNPAAYDLVFAGFWVEAENANHTMVGFLQKLSGIKTALFATLGAYPDTQHAAASMKAAVAQIPDAVVVDRFICQGAIDPEMIEWMEMLPENDKNAPTEARRTLWKDAASHPDENDLNAVAKWAQQVLKNQAALA
ncbi:flavodoxin family protein [Pontiellaceae bacterium B12219]|nr:flavodoxin family protein [Pontiellaceae bacterium B12219]